MFGLGMAEVVVICVIGLLLFGSQLPSIARSLGKSVREFQNEANNFRNDLEGR